ncbi:MAG TPA: metalloregulator ArsR/SmtB family transcription factor [Bacteroidales bacterium]|jgi:DNA-binding transcriptional ArsR family regulator|nr:metalloregulator ArsR/SmtB family transcription factor [Bacteroidales bacterium]
MTQAKKEKFEKDDIRLAKIAKALAHPARIAIIRHLAMAETCCFNEIANVIPLAGSTVSQHLSELKSAGLVKGSFELPRINYCLNEDEWRQARKLLKSFAKIKPGKDKDDISD